MVAERKKKNIRGKCYFCAQGKDPDFRAVDVLEKYISERGKILGKDITGLCNKHQLRLARAIKRARFLALLPFVSKVK